MLLTYLYSRDLESFITHPTSAKNKEASRVRGQTQNTSCCNFTEIINYSLRLYLTFNWHGLWNDCRPSFTLVASQKSSGFHRLLRLFLNQNPTEVSLTAVFFRLFSQTFSGFEPQWVGVAPLHKKTCKTLDSHLPALLGSYTVLLHLSESESNHRTVFQWISCF